METKQNIGEPSVLSNVPTERIHRNPHNPRILFDERPLYILRDSIAEVGILVPLLIYWRKRDDQYVILDGERRWLCAKELGLPIVPANIIDEPSTISNVLTMFNIHNVREPWELMPTALKLEVVMRELKTESEVKLAKLTGLNRSNVRRCKMLLSYDKSYQDMMLVVDPEQRTKPDFFIEMYPALHLIRQKLPQLSNEFPGNKLVDAFLKKYQEKKLTNVVDFRKIRASIRNAEETHDLEVVESNLHRFLTEKDSALDEYFGEDQMVTAQKEQALKRSCQLLLRRISEWEQVSDTTGIETRELLLRLRDVIDAKLEAMQFRNG